MATAAEINARHSELTAEREVLAEQARHGNVQAAARLQQILPWISALATELTNARRLELVDEAIADGQP
ncbi:hypothetical protein [Lentisalinibacter orientalis]|uniref:hypothetical protein n=1 Tax=Lentisalinibacter orientalis TaxID=2992241 RepID=UPI00386B9986